MDAGASEKDKELEKKTVAATAAAATAPAEDEWTFSKHTTEFVFPDMVKGTFGGRQGLETISTGPFTHSFSFE